jgi:methylmalonyl-CoA mutase cobalamin-binding subunit
VVSIEARFTMSEKPTVLFVCVHNAGHSQTAAGFLRELAGDRVKMRRRVEVLLGGLLLEGARA